MSPAAPHTLRLVGYNMLNGGKGRLDPIAETLLYLAGDLVGLVEAVDPEGVAYLAKRMGCDWALAESSAGPWHVALLSRLSLQRVVNLSVRCAGLGRSALEAVVEADGHPLRVVVVHLSPGLETEDETRRCEELEQILSVLKEEELPTVLLGDFNASAPHHPSQPEASSPAVRERLAARGNRLEHRLVEHLMADGWVDAHQRGCGHEAKHTFTTGFPALRLDYIWLDAGLAQRLIAADVETGGFTPYCSDHFPVWASLRTNGQGDHR